MRPDPTRLFLIRHGEVEEKYHRVFGGRIDMNLSAVGQAQANALARALEGVCFKVLYCSPMQRARQTIAPLASQCRAQPTIIEGLHEVDFGDWTGLGWQELHDRYQVSAFEWLDVIEDRGFPNGECSQSFRVRIEPCLKTILDQHPGETVGIVCHGGVIRMLLSILLEIPLRRMAAFEVDYASISEVHCRPGKIELQLLNYAPWRTLA